MNELPKSVRDEMARQQLSGDIHPDADLLTAFAEGTATPAERVKLEQHLATCGQCREVMFLAAPQVEPEAAIEEVAAAPRKSWFRVWVPWAAAAAVLVVGTFTLVDKLTSPSQQQVAKSVEARLPAQQPPTTVPSSPALKNQVKNPPPASSANGQLVSPPESLDPTRQAYARVERGRRDKEESNAKDELKKSATDSIAGTVDRRFSAVVPKPPPPPPPAATAEIYASNRASRNTSLKPGPAAPMQNQAMQNQQNQYSMDQSVSRSNETVEVTAQSAPVMEAKTKSDAVSGAALTNFGRDRSQWRISSSGSVERFTGGSWGPVLTQPGTKFTVVATIGPIVWAGGTRGTLLRSVDGGSSWQSIQLPNVGTGENSTISKIEFHDAFTGTVSTADHRSWSTKDRGESWQQP